MSLTPGTRLSVFEITVLIGEGGMGQVYRATDTKLKREVAIKILPPAFVADHDRLARFQREAEVLASLNHPNIAAIYGLEESEGRTALVMELVAGDDLSQRIARGAIPIDEALPIAKQMAEALEAAHEQGIIHRDLKPANIKIRPDGTVKVLDFGLAKAMEPPSATSVNVSQAPTITTPAMMTGVGMILGTAAYMSPEQARGKPVDKRADIWAFGCVLYEMLTGARLFDAPTVSDTLAQVLMKEPDWGALPADTPAPIRKLLRRCLDKDRKRRLDSAAAARLEVEDAMAMPLPEAAGVAPAVAMVRRGRRRAAVLVGATALVAVVMAALSAVRSTRSDGDQAPVTRSTIDVAPAEELLSTAAFDRGRPSRTAVALSPDGRSLVFSGRRGDQVQLFMRRLDALEAVPIQGTEGGDMPFFSPDGQWIGFWAAATGRCVEATCNGSLRKVPLAGGPALEIATTVGGNPRGASWGAGDTILFSQGRQLLRVQASGGQPVLFAGPREGEYGYVLPHVLPGGSAVVFTVQKQDGRWDNAQIVVRSTTSPDLKVLVEGGTDARYVPSGHLVYAKLGTLMAVAFDLEQLAVTGTPVGLVTDVMQAVNTSAGSTDTGAAHFSISDEGTLAYVTGGVYPDRKTTLAWVSRDGSRRELTPEAPMNSSLRLSPDGRRVVGTDSQADTIWIYDIARGGASRFSAEGGGVDGVVWTPDSRRLAFGQDIAGQINLFLASADGGSTPEQLTTGGDVKRPLSWTPDGSTLLFAIQMPPNYDFDVWAYSTRDRTTRPLVAGPGHQRWAEVSPDGQWLAYASAESGRNEVYVQPFPGPGERYQVSTSGGGQPVWAHSGRELFYLDLPQAPDGTMTQMFAVDVTTRSTFSAGVPRPLFATPPVGGNPYRGYDISADDRRFLMQQLLDTGVAAPARQIVLVQHWLQELRRLVPSR